ncbi:acyl carrier protein [Streptomyces sp. NPDC006314]|uniref:acyl carrier protein n=1 Tax=Streptomyces sp. NPDC006314 TaxID=3154475 RepID=UPI0033B6C923
MRERARHAYARTQQFASAMAAADRADSDERTTVMNQPFGQTFEQSPKRGGDLLAAVTEVVLRNAPDPSPLADAGPDASLTAHGFDSMRVVRLLVDLEATLGVSLPSDAITAETFGSVRSIADAVRRTGGAPPAPPR